MLGTPVFRQRASLCALFRKVDTPRVALLSVSDTPTAVLDTPARARASTHARERGSVWVKGQGIVATTTLQVQRVAGYEA